MHDVTKIILQSGRDQTRRHRTVYCVTFSLWNAERTIIHRTTGDGAISATTLLAQSGRKRIRIDGVNSNKAYNG